jgi:MFS family permease
MAFVSTNTVIPGFLTTLGASSTFIGLISSLQSASWLLPQLFVARLLADKVRKKPYLMWPAAIGRSLLFVMAVLIWSTGARPTWLIMLALLLVIVGFWVADGSWGEYIPRLWRVFKEDRVFRRFILARQMSGLGSLAMPFYMPYALERLGLPAQTAGRYTSIGVLGSIVAALVFAWLNERYGSKRVILASLTLGILVPCTALLLPAVVVNPTWLAWGYGLVFFLLSALMSSMMPGWMTYVLEWAPEQDRSTYVGLTNTLNGITPLLATLGGLILRWTGGNYRLLFAITAIGLAIAWPLPLALPEPRQRQHAADTAPVA